MHVQGLAFGVQAESAIAHKTARLSTSSRHKQLINVTTIWKAINITVLAERCAAHESTNECVSSTLGRTHAPFTRAPTSASALRLAWRTRYSGHHCACVSFHNDASCALRQGGRASYHQASALIRLWFILTALLIDEMLLIIAKLLKLASFRQLHS